MFELRSLKRTSEGKIEAVLVAVQHEELRAVTSCWADLLDQWEVDLVRAYLAAEAEPKLRREIALARKDLAAGPLSREDQAFQSTALDGLEAELDALVDRYFEAAIAHYQNDPDPNSPERCETLRKEWEARRPSQAGMDELAGAV